MSNNVRKINLIYTTELRHIEGFSKKRVVWLKNKILKEGTWTVPLKVDKYHNLVMDGQHRMEVAKELGLKVVPCLVYDYEEVEVWSLRDNHEVTPQLIIDKSISENIYPYKTAKHAFPDGGDMKCSYLLDDLKEGAG